MGRTLKRVPLDFDWPLKKVWDGYLNPHWKPCPEEGKTCFGGETAGSKWLSAIARLIAIVGEEAAVAPHAAQFKARGRIYPHPYLEEWGMAPRTEVPRDVHKRIAELGSMPRRMAALDKYVAENPPRLLPLTDDIAALVRGLTGKDHTPFGYDHYPIYEALLKVAGMPEGWGCCPVCNGEGMDPAVKAAYDAWEESEPPNGEGFQLWETTSEGSPVSPVFKTLAALCDWCAENATTFGSNKASAAQWRKMLDEDFVCHVEGNNVFI